MVVLNKKTDPSDIQQYFQDFQVKILCCRYWKISQWEFHDLSAPFWRIYHNTIKGAVIYFKGRCIELTSEKIILIPPYTSFSSTFLGSNYNNENENIVGSRIQESEKIDELPLIGSFDHLFIHFNLGIHSIHCIQNIFEFKITEEMGQHLSALKKWLKSGNNIFEMNHSLLLLNLIFGQLAAIPSQNWLFNDYDQRINKTVNYIYSNINSPLNLKSLSDLAGLAPNSYARLFKWNVGQSVHQFIKNCRSERAMNYLHHSNYSIEEIADRCGFYDRHHFSKVFKNLNGVTPVEYRIRKTVRN